MTLSEDIIRWKISGNVRQDVVEKMNYRAQLEKNEFRRKSREGNDFKSIHKEAIARGERYQNILRSIFMKTGIPDNCVCADLGSGTGTFAALVSRHINVQRVFAVEISEQFTTEIMPITFDYFHAHKEKISRVVGDFNRLEFQDEYLDFAVETGSFHHSEDILKTLSECYRVLKPGGFLMAIERSRSNYLDSAKREEVLDRELSNEMKKKYGIPLAESYTRRMWGEHELTYSEWNQYFRKVGFLPKMIVAKPFIAVQPFKYFLHKFCSIGRGLLEPFVLPNDLLFLRQPRLYLELLRVPIFLCHKPDKLV